MGGGKGDKRKEGLTQNHSANRVTHPKSGCGSDWITHNTPDVTDRKSDRQEAIDIFHRNYVRVLGSQDRDKDDDISVSDI